MFKEIEIRNFQTSYLKLCKPEYNGMTTKNKGLNSIR